MDSAMPKEILLNAFNMATVGHQSAGLWTHPRDRSRGYKDLETWTELARLLERGLFDGLFLADVLGTYDVYGGGPNAALQAGAQVPLIDPMLLVSAMAASTTHLGFGVTCSLGHEPPYMLARRMSTLDHLTKGRMGWNIVSGYLDSAARAMGSDKQVPHDRRYDLAEEYMAVVYKLWEGSWEDGAVTLDRSSRTFSDPSKVHAVHHHGDFYKVDAVHLCEPSPQRTPVLYQAGASGRGQRFAAAHAECVFINGPTDEVVGEYVKSLRKQLVAIGRAADAVKVFSMATVIVDETDALAEAKHQDYRRHINHAGTLALMSGWMGIDFAKYGLDDVLEHVQTEAMRTAIDNFTSKAAGRAWKIRDIAEFGGIGGRGPVFVGSARTIADRMEKWMEISDVDGFNLAYAVYPETFVDFVRLVVPELQSRGRFKTAYREGTLREKLFGEGPRLARPHQAAGYRRA